jgi:hypothetical protein
MQSVAAATTTAVAVATALLAAVTATATTTVARAAPICFGSRAEVGNVLYFGGLLFSQFFQFREEPIVVIKASNFGVVLPVLSDPLVKSTLQYPNIERRKHNTALCKCLSRKCKSVCTPGTTSN